MTVTPDQFAQLIQRLDDLTQSFATTRRDVARLQFSTTLATRYFKRVAEHLGIQTQDLDGELDAIEAQSPDTQRAPADAPTNPRASVRPIEE